MFVPELNPPEPINVDTTAQTDFPSCVTTITDNLNVNNIDITKTGSIQILVFPPKNKQFVIDEQTNEIAIKNDVVASVSAECQPGNVSFKELCKIERTFETSGFLKGCKWSPDGLCLLTASDDFKLRIFEFPEEIDADSLEARERSEPVLCYKEGGTVYDYVWYPFMNSSSADTCVFASTSQDSPIHLWDAFNGRLRATYQVINQFDEVTSAFSLCFSPDGSKLYAGLKKSLSIFNIAIPGRVSEKRNLKQAGDYIFQSSIVSAIAVNPYMPSVYALGSYDKSVGIYTEPNGDLQCVLHGHSGGVTHILFSPDGTKLYSGGRRDHDIVCWDLRNPGQVLCSYNRKVDTNQRIYFDLKADGRTLITGNTNGQMGIYRTDAECDHKLLGSLEAHSDCTNGVSFHPNQDIIATSSGQRHFDKIESDSESDESDLNVRENSVKIWSYQIPT